MKKKFLFLPVLGLAATFGLGACLIANDSNVPHVAYAEEIVEEPVEVPTEEPVEEPAEVFESFVVIDKLTNGNVTVDKTEGHVGDIVTITATPDFLYLVKSATVNGNVLIESETTRGVFTFALVEGENKISVLFAVDEEIVGVFATMVEQYNNKDWTHLFSIENVLTIVKWIFDGGILIAIIRYFVKDKKLADKLEKKVEETTKNIVPDATKEAVTTAVQGFVTPIFEQLNANQAEIAQAMSVFAKCMALSQENTPESRKAILDELSTIKFGDLSTIKDVREYIDKQIKEYVQAWNSAMTSLKNIQENNENIINEKEENKNEKNKEKKYDGTSI